MRKEDILTIAFALDTGAPLTLETLHLSTESALLGIIFTSPMVISLYLVLRTSWPDRGLYTYIRGGFVGRFQLYSWVGSYFLYLSYTLDYAFLYGGLKEYLPFLISAVATSLVLAVDWGSYLILPVTLLQLSLSVPLGWRFSPLLTGTSGLSFTELLNSSLLLVCLTLIPYWRGRSDVAWVVPVSLLFSGSLAVVGSFFVTSTAETLQALSMVGLVLAEGIALRNVLGTWRLRAPLLPLAFLGSILLSFINPSEYYDLTIPPSVALLYISLALAFLYLPVKGWGRLAQLWSVVLMIYGLYQSLVIAQGLQLTTIVVAVLSCLLGSWLNVLLRRKGGTGRGKASDPQGRDLGKSVCPYTITSFILSSFMIECGDLALNHPLAVGGSWDSLEPNGTGLTSRITPTLLGIAHIGVGGHHLSAKIRYKQI